MVLKPNVILIVLDTVRADRLSCYGHYRKTTPHIDEIAKEGALFKNAFSTASWTLPSHASIFTGKYPSYHKVLGSNIYLDESNLTIAEILSKNGYRTLSVAGCRILTSINGFDKGFHECIEIYEPNPFQKIYNIPIINRKAALKYPRDTIRTLLYDSDKYVYRTNEFVKNWMKKNYLKKERKQPFFLFINYFGCHSPHIPPKPFGEWFCRFLDYSKLDIQKLRFIASEDGIYKFIFKLIQASDMEWETIKTWYDGQLFYLDHYVGELIDFLEEKKICDDTLLIITSDHGENFGEHGLAHHKFCVYDTLQHVPLIMRYPSSVPENCVNSNLISHIDIFPTILDTLNIAKPNDIQGESLHPFDGRNVHTYVCAEHGQEQDFLLRTQRIPQSMLPELKKVDLGYKSIRDNRFKYIISSQGKEELYDIHHDPSESKNISPDNPEKSQYFKSTLEKTINIRYFGETPEKKIEGEVLERLKALGYL